MSPQEARSEEVKNQLDGLKTKEKTRMNDIKTTERKIAALEQDLADPPTLESVDELNELIVSLS